jgi:hypothetical protein
MVLQWWLELEYTRAMPETHKRGSEKVRGLWWCCWWLLLGDVGEGDELLNDFALSIPTIVPGKYKEVDILCFYSKFWLKIPRILLVTQGKHVVWRSDWRFWSLLYRDKTSAWDTLVVPCSAKRCRSACSTWKWFGSDMEYTPLLLAPKITSCLELSTEAWE